MQITPDRAFELSGTGAEDPQGREPIRMDTGAFSPAHVGREQRNTRRVTMC